MNVFTLYRFYAADDTLLYIGRTIKPEQRLINHSHKKWWWIDIATITLERHPDLVSLAAAEREAIQTEKPLHNIVYNDCSRCRPTRFSPTSTTQIGGLSWVLFEERKVLKERIEEDMETW